MTKNKKLVSKLGDVMKRTGVSDRRLAALTGVSTATVYKAKKSPVDCSMASLKKMADSLNVDVCELFTEE